MGYGSQTAWDYAEDEGYYPSSEMCGECKETHQKQDEAAQILIDLVAMLYGKKPYDKDDVEQHLHDLCWLFELKQPNIKDELVIHAIKAKKDSIFNISHGLARGTMVNYTIGSLVGVL